MADNKIGVLGAGLMGAGIAEVTIAGAKKEVVLKDARAEGLGRGLSQMFGNLNKKTKKRRMTE